MRRGCAPSHMASASAATSLATLHAEALRQRAAIQQELGLDSHRAAVTAVAAHAAAAKAASNKRKRQETAAQLTELELMSQRRSTRLAHVPSVNYSVSAPLLAGGLTSAFVTALCARY
jgi:hypothetical protein